MMPQPRIQDAQVVAHRALCLGAILKRGEIEITFQNLDQLDIPQDLHQRFITQHHDQHAALRRWVVTEGLSRHLTGAERILLDMTLGRWSERTIISTSWRVESLGVMLWALNYLEGIPKYDTQFEPDEVLSPLEVLTPTIDILWQAHLRPATELLAMRDQAEYWNWRTRAMDLERMGVRPAEGVTFREIVHATAQQAYNQGYLTHLLNGDFPAFDKPYAELDHDQHTLVSSIAYERYSALAWLCELSAQWESLPVDR